MAILAVLAAAIVVSLLTTGAPRFLAVGAPRRGGRSALYCFTPLGKNPQAGIFVPGPLWFRRTVVGLSGAFALVAGIAELVRS
jgi:hypothetical protein